MHHNILSLQVPPLPEGITDLRFLVQYESDKFTFPHLVSVLADLSDDETTYNTTIIDLARDTEYTVRVRAEVQYQLCFSFLPGNYSEALTVSTNATRKCTIEKVPWYILRVTQPVYIELYNGTIRLLLFLITYIYCSSVGPSSIQVRLVPPDPSTPFMGRLEVFHSNQWGTVCHDFFSTREAQVVCGMLNYTRANCSVPRARFGKGVGRVMWLISCLSNYL